MHVPVICIVAADNSAETILAPMLSGDWAFHRLAGVSKCLDSVAGDRIDCLVVDLDYFEGKPLARPLRSWSGQRIPCVAVTRAPDSIIANRFRSANGRLGPRLVVRHGDNMGFKGAVLLSLLSWLNRPARPQLSAPVPRLPPVLDPDFRALFDKQATNDLVLTPDLRIAAISRSYAETTNLNPLVAVGYPLFEVFPDNPENPDADGVAKLSASLNRARMQLLPDQMPLQRYDIPKNDDSGCFEERWWHPINHPIRQRSQLKYFVHRVEDVTRFVRLARAYAGLTI